MAAALEPDNLANSLAHVFFGQRCTSQTFHKSNELCMFSTLVNQDEVNINVSGRSLRALVADANISCATSADKLHAVLFDIDERPRRLTREKSIGICCAVGHVLKCASSRKVFPGMNWIIDGRPSCLIHSR